MTEMDNRHAVWRDVGPLLSGLHKIVADVPDSWMLVFGNSLVINVASIGTSARYICKINLGKLNADDPLEFYEVLLSFNLMTEEIKGARMGIDGPRGNVWMVFEFESPSNNPHEMAEALTYIAKLARNWMRVLNEPTLLQDGAEHTVATSTLLDQCV
jgi:hypothetical protein